MPRRARAVRHHAPPRQGVSARRREQVRQARVVVVRGSADHIEHVLRRAKARYVTVSPAELAYLPLHSQQVLMVNCRGVMSAAARRRVKRFVAAGGFLYTTDHAVRMLVQRIFPRTIAFNNKTTRQGVFPMELTGRRGLLAKLGRQSTRRWQLAGGGYLFRILDKQRVKVLMRSPQVARKYGGSGVLGVRFRYGDGQVIHVTGHFYTQPGQRGGAGNAFAQLSDNVVSAKRADLDRIRKLYRVRPRRRVRLQSAPSAAAGTVSAASSSRRALPKRARVRVLERKGKYSKVRDEQGNEGWVPSDAL